jgi:farnesyl-diphosphate farnesyltransferase
MTLLDEADDMVRTYSTTWYTPISSMPQGLREATTCAYLCMRGIDEIEDHPELDGRTKADLLRQTSSLLQTRFTASDFQALFRPYAGILPEVTERLTDWTALAPPPIGPRILDTFSTMAERMAAWAESDFRVRTERDLDQYTYAVSGTLVLLLSDLWAWHDGTDTNRTHGIGYGRALQTINIIVDRDEDSDRGADFWPDDWTLPDMLRYADRELELADAYLGALPPGPARTFCAEPLHQAHRARHATATG